MIRKTVTGLALFVTLLAGMQAPAQAAQADCQNYSEVFCLFFHAGYGNPIWRQTPDQVSGCRQLSDAWNDQTTVAWNNTGGHHTLRLWKHYPCGGSGNQFYDLPSNSVVNFAGTNMNDAVSAVEDREF